MPKTVKQRITIHLSLDLIERVRNAVYWTPGLTIASMTEEALEKALLELEKKRNAPFPQRKEELKTGRPVEFNQNHELVH